MILKKYEVKENKKDKQTEKFYYRILLSVIIFCIIVTVCKINPNTSNYVKNVLNNSYNFSLASEKTTEIFNNIKNVYKNIEDNFAWEE